MSDLTAAVDRFRKAIQTETLTGQWPTAANAHKDAKEESAKARAALLALLSPARPDGDVTITTQMRRHEAHRAAAALLVSDDEALLSIGRAISGALMTEQPAAAHARPGGEEATA